MDETTGPSGSRRRWPQRLLILLTILVTVALALMLEREPRVAPVSPATADQAQSAARTLKRVRAVAGDGALHDFAISWSDAHAIAAMGARATGVDRLHLAPEGSDVRIAASYPLALGLWANIDLRFSPANGRFPPVDMRIGQLPVPDFVARWGLRISRQAMARRGVALPPLDTVIFGLRVSPEQLIVRMRVPAGIDSVSPAAAGTVDAAAVARRFCVLSATHRQEPSPRFDVHVRRAFENAGTAQSNREALVALAMIVVGHEAGQLAGDAARLASDCASAENEVRLRGRADLAKHWALSAALAATLGPELSGAMGELKEVADSGPDGSGFSFIDLAADRAGIAAALAATDPLRAAATARRLAATSQERLLPVRALALSEGLSETEFARRFVDVRSPGYAAMVTRIDRVIAGHN
jgi:uncharacterized protein YfiM (DUF2279 family)